MILDMLSLLGLGLLYWNADRQSNLNLLAVLFRGVLTSTTFGFFNSTPKKASGTAPKL